jgi:hypothetical protein
MQICPAYAARLDFHQDLPRIWLGLCYIFVVQRIRFDRPRLFQYAGFHAISQIPFYARTIVRHG